MTKALPDRQRSFHQQPKRSPARKDAQHCVSSSLLCVPNLTRSACGSPERHFRCTRCFRQNGNSASPLKISTYRDHPSVLSLHSKTGIGHGSSKPNPPRGSSILQWTVPTQMRKSAADPARRCKSAAHVALALQFDRKRRDLPPPPSPLSARRSHFLCSLLSEGRGGPHPC